MRTVSLRVTDLIKTVLPIGFVGENLHTKVIIDCKSTFEEYPTAVVSMTVKPPKGDAYPAIVTREGDIVTWDVSDSDLLYEGSGEIQLAFVVNEVIAKSYIGHTRILRSIIPTGEIPTPIEDWITKADGILDSIPTQIDAALEEAKESGEFDGFSPVIETEEITGGHQISITDKTHTETFDVMDGDPSGLIYTVDVNIDEAVTTATCETRVSDIVDAYKAGKIILCNIYQPLLNNTRSMVYSCDMFVYESKIQSFEMYIVYASTLLPDGSEIMILGMTDRNTDIWQADTSTSLMKKSNDDYFSASGYRIAYVATPTGNTDATNKQYVDEKVASIVMPIDDTAGAGDTDKVWSADKVTTELSGKYEKPSGGIPSTDLASGVTTSLGKADTAYQKPSGGIPGTDLADSYIKEPASDGSNGQVLTTDGNGGRTWTTPSGGVSDVQVNGTSVVSQGVANVPIADSSNLGVVLPNSGFTINGTTHVMGLATASDSVIKGGANANYAITPYIQHKSVFYGLAKASGDTSQASSSNSVGTYTEDAQSKISDMLNKPVSVSGSTPSITAKSGVRYICGEVSTLSITAPASGCIDVVFSSGSTATVLTVASAKSGVSAIKWVGADDPTALEANKTYEINILDGEYGVIASWT